VVAVSRAAPLRRSRRSRLSAEVTILDVARAARVSTATVSRVLSHPSKVVEATRRQVLRVVAQLNYAPNAAAKSLRTFETRKLLAIIPDIANPFFALILQGIEEAALREGYSVLVGDTLNSLERDTHYATMLPRREVDGLIVLSQRVPGVIKSWARSLPMMAPIVTGFISGEEFGVSSAGIDNGAAATEAIEHLHGLGHRLIGVITGPAEAQPVQERLRAVRRAARRRGTACELLIEHGKFTIESGLRCAAQLLSRPRRPTAILCFSDGLATGVLECARRTRISVPEALSVMGFDDLPVSAYLTPPLTTIALPMRDVGRETVRLLVGRLRGNIIKAERSTLPFQLITRGSTAAARRAHTTRV